MASAKDQFKSSFGTFASRERELSRRRASRDASDAIDAERTAANVGESTPGAPDRPSS